MSYRAPRLSRAPQLLVVALAVLVLLGTAAPGFAAAEPTKPNDPSARGRALVTEFMTILQDGDRKALARFLDPSFQLQRADGTGVDKAVYVANPAVVREFQLGETLIGVQHGDVLTVRWSVLADVVVAGQQYGKAAAPRLSTFRRDGKRWRMTSHANFNLPV